MNENLNWIEPWVVQVALLDWEQDRSKAQLELEVKAKSWRPTIESRAQAGDEDKRQESQTEKEMRETEKQRKQRKIV